VESLLALRRKYSWLIAAGSILSMKNSSDAIGNRTRDFPVCSAVPQPTEFSYEYLTEINFEEAPALILRAIVCHAFLKEEGKPRTCQVVTSVVRNLKSG